MPRNVDQNPVAQIDRVIQAEDQARRRELPGEILEDALPSEAGLRVFTHGSRRIGFDASPSFRTDKGIHISGGEDHDPRFTEVLRHLRRHYGIHRPGKIGIAGRSKFPASILQFVQSLGRSESGDGNNAGTSARSAQGFQQPLRQSGPHFAACSQHHRVSAKPAGEGNIRLARLCQDMIELLIGVDSEHRRVELPQSDTLPPVHYAG